MRSVPRGRRREAGVFRSQLALELALSLIALVAGSTLLRLILLMANVDLRVWSSTTIAWLTAPVVLPLANLPGGDRVLVGRATLADVTVALLLLVVPSFLLTRKRPAV